MLWVLKISVSSERRDGSFEYPRQVFVKKPSYMSITHSYLEPGGRILYFFFVCFPQENIAINTAANCLSLYYAMLSSKTCSGDLCIFRSSDVMRSYLRTRDIFVASSPSHTPTSIRRRTSEILDALLQGQE